MAFNRTTVPLQRASGGRIPPWRTVRKTDGMQSETLRESSCFHGRPSCPRFSRRSRRWLELSVREFTSSRQ